MTFELSNFTARLRELISYPQFEIGNRQFSELALELFTLQFQNNFAYQKICETRRLTPQVVKHWTQIPFVPTGAFKELELTSLAPNERTVVFHSSGTTGQKPSRHFHSVESLAVYETSLWTWFEQNVFGNSKYKIQNLELIILVPPPSEVPYSSLACMFEAVKKKLGAPGNAFVGKTAANDAWILNYDATLAALGDNSIFKTQNSKLILGTAFSFVHLLDYLAENNLQFQLPENSRVIETGGYKNRSRTLPKAELHALITKHLGIASGNIICEYGMSELSSQAYDSEIQNSERQFHFPSWARVQIISPETEREIGEGESGLIRVFDLANVFSVAAIQTEDLGIRRGDGFELIGRTQFAESRGCSLMTA